jgi:hypothetical protein
MEAMATPTTERAQQLLEVQVRLVSPQRPFKLEVSQTETKYQQMDKQHQPRKTPRKSHFNQANFS